MDGTIATVDNLKKAMQLGGNILIEGLHGTGKTSMLRQAAEELGYSLAYFHVPTMDPYVDLAGIPTVVEGENGKHVEMVRKLKIMDSDVKFFDEVNRGAVKVKNSVMEVILEGSIEGEPLPNHKVSVAAVNPSNGDYDTTRLDAALIDRFDFYFIVAEKPDRGHFVKELGKYGIVLVDWWEDQFSKLGEDGPVSYTHLTLPTKA